VPFTFGQLVGRLIPTVIEIAPCSRPPVVQIVYTVRQTR